MSSAYVPETVGLEMYEDHSEGCGQRPCRLGRPQSCVDLGSMEFLLAPVQTTLLSLQSWDPELVWAKTQPTSLFWAV